MNFKFCSQIAALGALVVASGFQQASAIAVVPTPHLFGFHLTGTIGDVESPLSSVFSAGQTLTVDYTVDTSIAARSGSDSTFAFYDAISNFSFSVGSYNASATGASEIQVDNNPGGGFHDRYGLNVNAGNSSLTGPNVDGSDDIRYALTSFLARFDDTSDSVFSNALTDPTGFSLASFTSTQFFISFDPIGVIADPMMTGIFTTLDITPLDITPPVVPEPATVGMIGGGLLLLAAAGMARRRMA